MAEGNNQSGDLIIEQIDIEPETSEGSDNNIPKETILEKVLASDNIIEDAKKGLLDLKQSIGDKIDVIQDQAGEKYDDVSTELAETVEEAEKGLIDLKQEIGEQVDIVQDKAIELGNTALDGVSEVTKTTVNYWSARVDSILNGKKSIEAKLDENKILTIGPEGNTPKKNRPVLDEYKQKENRKTPEENAREFLQMDIEDAALDILDGTYRPTGYKDKKVIESFDKIPLKKVFEAHNKATSYNDFQDTFETYGEITESISNQYIGSEMKRLKSKGIKKISPEMKEKLIEKSKLRTRELMKIIGYFLRKEKGGEFENIENNKKKYKNIGDLLNNKEFKKFIESEKSLFNKDVGFTEFKSKQVKGLVDKLATTQKQDLVSPGLTFDVIFGDTVTHKNISLRGENTVDGIERKDGKKSLYIMGYKYKLDGIKDIESIKIDGDNFIIKGNIFLEPNSEITFSKEQFANGVSDLVFKGYQKLHSTNGKKDITIQRDII